MLKKFLLLNLVVLALPIEGVLACTAKSVKDRIVVRQKCDIDRSHSLTCLSNPRLQKAKNPSQSTTNAERVRKKS